MKQAQYSNHLVFHQRVPQILWVTPVTYFWSWRLRWVQLVLTTDRRSAFSYIWCLAYVLLFGLLLAYCVVRVPCCCSQPRLFFMFDLVRLLTSLIGKMIASTVIFFVWKSRKIPSCFMVLHPRMRSYLGLVILYLSNSTMSGVTWYSLLFEYSKIF